MDTGAVMTKDNMFRTDTDLWPNDPAFTDAVYMTQGMTTPTVPQDFSAKVISSPKKAGKTTQLNQIGAKHLRLSRFDQKSKIFIPLKKRDQAIPEQELKDLLVNELDAKGGNTFGEVILSSKRIKKYKGRKVLALMEVENLSEGALVWLLSGIKQLEGKTTKTLNLQVLIDGSFAVDTLTWGETSPYPLDHLYPPEFSQATQKDFINLRVSQLKLMFTNAAYQALWEVTFGDKYLTQAICKRILEPLEPGQAAIVIDDNRVSETVEAYTKERPSEDHLKPDLLKSFFILSEQSPGNPHTPQREFYLKNLLNNIQDAWERLDVKVRDQAYRGGVIRRSRRGIELRAPLIRAILDRTIRRVWDVRTLLSSHFSLTGVAQSHQRQAEEISSQIIEHAYDDSLRILHVGLGRKVSDHTIEVQAAALSQGQYSGFWDVEAKFVKEGEEVWALMWAWDGPNGRDSRMRILPVKEL